MKRLPLILLVCAIYLSVIGSVWAENFANFALSTLATSIGSTDTSITLTSNAYFSTTAPFRLTIKDSETSTPEIEYVTAVSGNTYTVVRGYEGTTATAHSAGAQVAQFVTAGDITTLWNEASGALQGAGNLSDLANSATARTNLGLALGVNVEAWSAVLDAISTSQNQNLVIASPNGSSGTVSARALVNADLPTVGFSKGGTNATTATQGLDNLFGTSNTAPNAISPYRYYSLNNTSASYGFQNQYIFNGDPQNMPNLRKCIANIRHGVGRCLWIDAGDSTDIGINGSGVPQFPNESAYEAAMFTQDGIPSYSNSFSGNSATGGLRSGNDTRLTLNSWINNGLTTLGGNLFSSSAAGTALTWQPTFPIDTCIAMYTSSGANLANGTLQVGSGSTAALTSTLGGALSLQTATASAPAVQPCKVNYATSTGTLYAEAIRAYDSTQPGIDIMNAGWWGSILSQITDSSTNYASVNAMIALSPSVVKLKININDAGATTPISTFTSNLTTFVTTLQSHNIDVILETDNPTGFAAQPQYVDAMMNVAFVTSVPLVNSAAAWKSFNYANSTLGFMSDGLHPFSTGYSDQAYYVNTLFVNVVGSVGTPSVANAAPYTIAMNGIERMRVTTAGNVGIGTSAPSNPLMVVGKTSTDQFALSGAAYTGTAWTTTSPLFSVPAVTLNDTSGAGTITYKAASTFGIPTFNNTTAQTVSGLATLYVPTPIAGTNVTATNIFAAIFDGYIDAVNGITTGSIFNSGTSFSAGLTTAAGGIAQTGGTASFSANLNTTVGGVLASASTIAPTKAIHHVSGTAAIATITPPSGTSTTVGTTITLIADAAWTTTTSGNIQSAMTASANGVYLFVWDGSKWFIK